MKKFLAVILAVTLLCVSSVCTFAQTSDEAPTPIRPTTRALYIPESEAMLARENGMEIIDFITDPLVIQEMVDSGMAETKEGKLPLSITTYLALDDASDSVMTDNTQPSSRKAAISVSKGQYYNGQYFDDYDRDVIDGAARYTTTYEKSGTRSWNTSATGSVKVGVDLFSLADIEKSVSSSMGYSFGRSEKHTKEFQVHVPANKTWEIKVWVSYLVHTYTAKVGSTEIASGRAWRPNGLIIKKTEYAT